MLLIAYPSCRSRKIAPETDLSISQKDIDLFIKHKHKIEEITSIFNKRLTKSKSAERKQIFEEGKKEINNYLESQGLNPEIFMHKSKKILKCYLALKETGEENLKRKKLELEKREIPKEQAKQELEFYKRSAENFFRSYTEGLTEYEIRLIERNLKKISGVVEKLFSNEN